MMAQARPMLSPPSAVNTYALGDSDTDSRGSESSDSDMDEFDTSVFEAWAEANTTAITQTSESELESDVLLGLSRGCSALSRRWSNGAKTLAQ